MWYEKVSFDHEWWNIPAQRKSEWDGKKWQKGNRELLLCTHGIIVCYIVWLFVTCGIIFWYMV